MQWGRAWREGGPAWSLLAVLLQREVHIKYVVFMWRRPLTPPDSTIILCCHYRIVYHVKRSHWADLFSLFSCACSTTSSFPFPSLSLLSPLFVGGMDIVWYCQWTCMGLVLLSHSSFTKVQKTLTFNVITLTYTVSDTTQPYLYRSLPAPWESQ